jgi:hypothetical protein
MTETDGHSRAAHEIARGFLNAMTTRLPAASALLLLLAGFAFWPAYLSKLPSADVYTHAHAVLGVAWLLLVAQPLLIRASMRNEHRLLGRMGVFVGAAFVTSSVLMAHRSLSRLGAEQLASEGRLVYLPLAMAGTFAAALALAVRWRAVPTVHARFMAATALPLLDPLIPRIVYFYGPRLAAESLHQIPAFVLVGVVLAGLLGSLPRATKGRASLRRYACSVVAILLGFFAVPNTRVWLSIVTSFRALPLT